MSEYWVSHKKYFCKYCNIYIADDAPSKSQHEGGLRHKGNVERFVRGIYKAGEKRKNDLEEEQREMARVEQAANAAFAKDVSAGLVKPGSSSTPGPSKPAPSKPATKPSSPWANYSTAESLGFTDPDAERLKAEAEQRQTQGIVGEWELLSVEQPAPPAVEGPGPIPADPGAAAGIKREAEAPVDEEDSRQFKLRKKKVGVGLGEIYDPGLIPIKLKAKKEEPKDDKLPVLGGSSVAFQGPISAGPAATTVPTWSAKAWSKPTEAKPSTDITPDATESKPVSHSDLDVNQELQSETSKDTAIHDAASPPVKEEEMAQDPTTTKTEPEASSGGSLFRKRKLPTGKAGGRGRGR